MSIKEIKQAVDRRQVLLVNVLALQQLRRNRVEIEHLFDESIFNKKTRKKAKKIFGFHLSKLKEEGAKKVIVVSGFDSQKIEKERKGSFTIFDFRINASCAIKWISDGKLHREDGPAYQIYSKDNQRGQHTYVEYWYKGNRCHPISSINVIKICFEFYGEVILDEERVSNNILYIKKLTENNLVDCWYWVINGM